LDHRGDLSPDWSLYIEAAIGIQGIDDMIALTSYEQKIAAVLGLSRTGLSACRSVTAGGGRVWAWDDNLDRRELASNQGISIVNLDLCNWDRVKSLVLSPGIPLKHPRPHRLVRHAKAAGVPVIGDMELLAENQPERRIIGITGTNGKSTTSALIAHILQNASIGTQLGGNIGLPVLDLLPKPPDDIYVLELSTGLNRASEMCGGRDLEP